MNGPVLVLYRPMIPPNTGNIARLSVACRSRLLIVGKAGFDLSNKAAKRSGLDYWDQVNLTLYKKFKDFYASEVQNQSIQMVAVTKEGEDSIFDFRFEKNDLLVFGNETMGLPPALLKCCHKRIRIPMWNNNRSLNLSNAVAITSYFYLLQWGDKSQETFAYRNYFSR